MTLFLLTMLAIYIALYCLFLSYDQIKKQKNKEGGVAIFCLIPFILASPILYYFFR